MICWSLSQLSQGEGRVTPVLCWATCRQTSIDSHICPRGIFRSPNSPDKHVFGLEEEAEEPGENPRTGEDTPPNRKARDLESTSDLLAVRREVWLLTAATVSLSFGTKYRFPRKPILAYKS